MGCLVNKENRATWLFFPFFVLFLAQERLLADFGQAPAPASGRILALTFHWPDDKIPPAQ